MMKWTIIKKISCYRLKFIRFVDHDHYPNPWKARNFITDLLWEKPTHFLGLFKGWPSWIKYLKHWLLACILPEWFCSGYGYNLFPINSIPYVDFLLALVSAEGSLMVYSLYLENDNNQLGTWHFPAIIGP
jgi:hypothetical protein